MDKQNRFAIANVIGSYATKEDAIEAAKVKLGSNAYGPGSKLFVTETLHEVTRGDIVFSEETLDTPKVEEVILDKPVDPAQQPQPEVKIDIEGVDPLSGSSPTNGSGTPEAIVTTAQPAPREYNPGAYPWGSF